MTSIIIMKRIGILAVIASYLSAFLTWEGIVDLPPVIALVEAFLILIIGTLGGWTGLPFDIWYSFTYGRPEGENQLMKPIVIVMIWFLSTVCLTRYIGILNAAIGGVLIILYFTIAILGVGTFDIKNPGILIAGGIVHILSLFGAIVLIVHCLNA